VGLQFLLVLLSLDFDHE
jgi:hypothetical protein